MPTMNYHSRNNNTMTCNSDGNINNNNIPCNKINNSNKKNYNTHNNVTHDTIRNNFNNNNNSTNTMLIIHKIALKWISLYQIMQLKNIHVNREKRIQIRLNTKTSQC